MPRSFQADAMNKFAEIRADAVALLAYRPRYAELAAVTTPVLLLGGERSARWYGRTLEALHGALGNARLEIVAGAGHMLHAEAPRRFHALVAELAGQVLPDRG
jgi:pimeloyl-ACP methyl ester carboxylesterase